MMIDTTSETLVSFNDASDHIPGRPHLSQIYRWSFRGLRGVKLEWVQCGGKRFTSTEAIARFFARLTAAAGGEAAPMPTPRRRKREIEQAGRELAAAGFEVGGESK